MRKALPCRHERKRCLGVSEDVIRLRYPIAGNDFNFAGEASSNVKKKLTQLGLDPYTIKRIAIAMYEAEINAVIHANGGVAEVEIGNDRVLVNIRDEGPGIPDIEMAMREGFSTAPDEIREMGFGAGMGLPNIKRYSDVLEIHTEVGKGTTVSITVNI